MCVCISFIEIGGRACKIGPLDQTLLGKPVKQALAGEASSYTNSIQALAGKPMKQALAGEASSFTNIIRTGILK